jgi:endonuclease/exonuclease/phosphatase (EEP) superfamily protein YafD
MHRKLHDLFQAKIRPWELTAAAGCLICFVSLAVLAGRSWWMLDLASHFRFQYVVLLSIFSVVLLIASRWRESHAKQRVPQSSKWRFFFKSQEVTFSAVFALFALSNWLVIVPQCWVKPQTPALTGPKLRVMLLNVQRKNQNTEAALRSIVENDPDLLVLEEVDDHWWAALGALRETYRYHISDCRDDDFGIALLSKLPLTNATIMYLGRAEIPSAAAEVVLPGKLITVVGTHPLPPSSSDGTRHRNEQLVALGNYFRPVTGAKILLGDLNTTPWNHAFRRLLRDSGLIDGSRGFGYKSTWPSFLWPMRIPLDHCLVSADLRVDRFRVGERIGSDHFPVIVDLIVSTRDESIIDRAMH